MAAKEGMPMTTVCLQNVAGGAQPRRKSAACRINGSDSITWLILSTMMVPRVTADAHSGNHHKTTSTTRKRAKSESVILVQMDRLNLDNRGRETSPLWPQGIRA